MFLPTTARPNRMNSGMKGNDRCSQQSQRTMAVLHEVCGWPCRQFTRNQVGLGFALPSKSRFQRNSDGALSEHNVQKPMAGKKGEKNKYGYGPERGKAPPSLSASAETATSLGLLNSEIHHNENAFELMFLIEGVEAQIIPSRLLS